MNKDKNGNFYSSLSSVVKNINTEYILDNFKDPHETGFPELDKLLNGGITQGLTVVGASPSLGKSTLMLQISQNISKNGIPVLYFSLEMPDIFIGAKALSRQVFIDSEEDEEKKRYSAVNFISPKAIKKIKKTHWKTIENSRKIVEEECSNLYIIENMPQSEAEIKANNMLKPLTAKGILEITSEFISETGQTPVVVIDYLQLLSPDDSSDYEQRRSVEKTVEYMTMISKIAPTIAISSFSRGSYNKRPGMESFKETGLIEFSADVILALSFLIREGKKEIILDEEKSKEPRELDVIVLKNRYGKSGEDATVRFNYFAKYDYFKEASTKKEKIKSVTKRKASTRAKSSIVKKDAKEDTTKNPVDNERKVVNLN